MADLKPVIKRRECREQPPVTYTPLIRRRVCERIEPTGIGAMIIESTFIIG